MIPYRRIPETVFRSIALWYVIAGFVAGSGICLVVPTTRPGDRLVALLVALAIAAVLGATAVVRAALRLRARVIAAGKRVRTIQRRLARLERIVRDLETSGAPGSATKTLDLAAIGKGDPSVLAAARLDRAAFPRLVRSMEDDPPARSAGKCRHKATSTAREHSTPSGAVSDPLGTETNDLTTRNLLRQWRLGLRTGDLAACRTVFSALVDTADPAAVNSLKTQLDELAARTERSLRQAFSRRVRARDYAGMVTVGEHICRLLPDRPIAAEFRRIKPILLRRLAPGKGSGEPFLRVHSQ